MQLRRSNQRLALAVTLGLASAAALASAGTAQAQQQPGQATQTGSRYQVLVPNLEHAANAPDGFGKDVADAMRKSIDKLPRHISVSKNDLKDNLRKYKLKEDDLDCIKSRQLAVQMGAELVMCGSYEPASGGMNVKASFVGARTGETFEVQPFVASTPADAAGKIFSAFESYVNQIQLLAFCNEYLGSSQWQNALENCNKALQVSPTAAAYYGKARALLEISPDSLGAAYASVQEALKINATNTDALRMAGVLAARLGKSEESLQYFNQYLELNPGDVSVRVTIANEAAKAGNPDAARQIMEGGIKGDSTPPDIFMYAGHYALQAAQKLETDARANGAPDAKPPAKADSLYNLALGYYQKLYAKADTATDSSVLRNMVILLNRRGQSAQAVEIGRKMVAAKPKDAGAWSVYADALSGIGQTDQALAALDTAAKYDTAKASPIYAKKGQILLEKGRLDEAKAALQQAIQRGTVQGDDAAKVVFGAGYTNFQKGQYDAALQHFAVVRDLAETPATKAMANFFTGYVYFQRAAELAKKNPSKPSSAAADLFRRALGYFGQSDAYAAQQSGIRSQIDQMTSYANQYIKAVGKARG
ncbi:MAG TPA: tetratricopeptide repeat protein [Longimicrobiales bacterium]|nr:tetratricopeptide repeat protein [Longimicrobiales bacterium]